MSQISRGRYMMDPIYRHALDTIVRLVIEAVEEADATDDDGYTQRQRRTRVITEALVDAPTLLEEAHDRL